MYDYNIATGEHIEPGINYAIGLNLSDQVLDRITTNFRVGLTLQRQQEYQANRATVEFTPEYALKYGFYVGKPFYLSPAFVEKKNLDRRSTFLELGTGWSLGYQSDVWKLESVWLRSANHTKEAVSFSRQYGIRLIWTIRKTAK